ncbi:hypothetical protein C8Q79DRAFT_155724 [Trametes meyenii]|nr:hypothetical protein C8Q79DRAFT_155724 [Trametes meyenii]
MELPASLVYRHIATIGASCHYNWGIVPLLRVGGPQRLSLYYTVLQHLWLPVAHKGCGLHRATISCLHLVQRHSCSQVRPCSYMSAVLSLPMSSRPIRTRRRRDATRTLLCYHLLNNRAVEDSSACHIHPMVEPCTCTWLRHRRHDSGPGRCHATAGHPGHSLRVPDHAALPYMEGGMVVMCPPSADRMGCPHQAPSGDQ